MLNFYFAASHFSVVPIFTRIFHKPNFFHTPWYVTCYDDEDSASVIVSDWGNHTLDITRRQVDRKGLMGVTTDTVGNIYVC